jgi:hypothetical protein
MATFSPSPYIVHSFWCGPLGRIGPNSGTRVKDQPIFTDGFRPLDFLRHPSERVAVRGVFRLRLIHRSLVPDPRRVVPRMLNFRPDD